MVNEIEELLQIKCENSSGLLNLFKIEYTELESHLFNLKSYFSYFWLLDIQLFESVSSQHNVLRYIFINVESGFKFAFEVNIMKAEEVKSITHLWRNAGALEQKIYSLYDLKFSRNYLPLYEEQYERSPSIKTTLFGACEEVDYIKCSDPLSTNTEDIKVKLVDGVVKQCNISSGFYHIGLEDILNGSEERSRYHILESYFPLKSTFWTFLMSKNHEESLGINISDRAKAIRMVLLELTRVQNHLVYFYNLSKEYELSALSYHSRFWIKLIQSLFISYSGNEFGTGVIRPGGLIKDISQVWLTRTGAEIVKLEKSLSEVYHNLIMSKPVKDEFSFDLIGKKLASAWSLSGPVVRAVGINLDLRKSDPLYFYKDVDFEVPVGTQGKGFDLILVKMEEIFQSLKIIIQVLDNLPTGEVMHESLSEFARVKASGNLDDEDVYIDSVKNYLKPFEMDTLSLYEGSNGILGIAQNYTDQKQNIKILSSDVSLRVIFEKSVIGNRVELIPPLWKVVGVDLKEVEL